MRTGETGGLEFQRIDGDPVDRWLHWADPQEDGCWLWGGTLDKHGYGAFGLVVDGVRSTHRAHRWGYINLVAPLSDDLVLDHLCRNRACVRPDHLEPVSQAENIRRGLWGTHNAAKTHCKHGHEFTPENTYTSPGRVGRQCRECSRRSTREIMQRKRNSDPDWVPYSDRSECPKGHPYTEENTVRNKNGHRSCRECQRVKGREYMRERRAQAKAARSETME